MDKYFEWVAFLRIIISPLLASAIIALIYYIFTPDIPNIFIIIGIIFIGLVLGIVWAINIKKKGSVGTFLSQIYSGDDRQNKE